MNWNEAEYFHGKNHTREPNQRLGMTAPESFQIYFTDEFAKLDYIPWQFGAIDVEVAEGVGVLRKLHDVDQPVDRLILGPVVNFGAHPLLPQFAHRNVRVVAMEGPLPLLVAVLVFQLLAQELRRPRKESNNTISKRKQPS